MADFRFRDSGFGLLFIERLPPLLQENKPTKLKSLALLRAIGTAVLAAVISPNFLWINKKRRIFFPTCWREAAI